MIFNLDAEYLQGGAIVFGLMLSPFVMYVIALGLKKIMIKQHEKKQRKEYAKNCAEAKKELKRVQNNLDYAEFVALASRYDTDNRD